MTEPVADTERRCNLASGFWWSVVTSLTSIAYRTRGEDDLAKIWYKVLTSEQGERYGEGLRKLGIRDDEPPAVRAAKYHFFSNSIGGLSMQYVEEAPNKVWIRYIGPNGTYPGLGMLLAPAGQRRVVFSSWHPRNGELMGCPRLGYVATKFTAEGDPYDEGYFMEYDHDLKPEERIRFEVVHKTPEYNPAKAPKLDPADWPKARLLKGMRNFARDYARNATHVLEDLYGELATTGIITTAMRCMGVQLGKSFAAQFGAEGGGMDAIETLHAGMLEACYEEFEVITRTDTVLEIRRDTFFPFVGYVPDPRRESFFEFQSMATRMLNGHVRSTRRTEGQSEIWRFEDIGEWLW